MDMFLPEPVKWVIEQIASQEEEEIFLVGGCVRDLLLGREIHDYDMTTSMSADTMMEVFSTLDCKAVPTGLRHGTITVIRQHLSMEITTYRIEGAYENHRSPSSVKFTRNLQEDLKRRDFTINAMAYHPDTGLIDIFGGQQDLHDGVIRCVGNPSLRFQEDALRILRAVRFSCQLHFRIEDGTKKAIQQQNQLLDYISRERIRDEFVNLLQSDHENLLQYLRDLQLLPRILPDITCIYDFEQHSPWHKHDVFQHTDIALNSARGQDLQIKLALVLHDLGKTQTQTWKNGTAHYYGHASNSAHMADRILRSLVFPNRIVKEVTQLIRYHDTYMHNRSQIRKMLYLMENDFLQVERLLTVQACDDSAKVWEKVKDQQARIAMNRQLLHIMKLEHDYLDRKDLQVNGFDMMQLGFEKHEIRDVLDYLFFCILKTPENNKKEKLMEFAISYRSRQNKNQQVDQMNDRID